MNISERARILIHKRFDGVPLEKSYPIDRKNLRQLGQLRQPPSISFHFNIFRYANKDPGPSRWSSLLHLEAQDRVEFDKNVEKLNFEDLWRSLKSKKVEPSGPISMLDDSEGKTSKGLCKCLARTLHLVKNLDKQRRTCPEHLLFKCLISLVHFWAFSRNNISHLYIFIYTQL